MRTRSCLSFGLRVSRSLLEQVELPRRPYVPAPITKAELQEPLQALTR